MVVFAVLLSVALCQTSCGGNCPSGKCQSCPCGYPSTILSFTVIVFKRKPSRQNKQETTSKPINSTSKPSRALVRLKPRRHAVVQNDNLLQVNFTTDDGMVSAFTCFSEKQGIILKYTQCDTILTSC